METTEMMEITKEQLLAVMPNAADKVDKYLVWFNYYAEKYHINTKLRWIHFLSQIAHESGELKYTHELGKESYFKKYETGRLAKMLGNTKKGDGAMYKGRGFIQLTGRANYTQFAIASGVDVVNHPDQVEIAQLCVQVSMWYWDTHGCNEVADQDDLIKVTKKVNGGTNGLSNRQLYYQRAKIAIK